MTAIKHILDGLKGPKAWAVFIFGCLVGSWGVERALEWAMKVANNMPAASPARPPSGAAQKVYEALSSPTIPVGTIEMANLSPEGASNYAPANPYGQLAALQAWNWPFVLLSLALIACSLIVYFRCSERLRQLITPVLGLGGSVVLAFGIAVNTLTSSWDEVFAFASQAANLAAGKPPGVSTTGPRAYAESSADAAASHITGILMALIPSLDAETALVIAYLLASWIVLAVCVALAGRWFRANVLVMTVAASLLVILSPEVLGALGSGMPLVLASSGLVLLGLAMTWAFSSGSPWPLVVAAFVASWIRWEYMLVALVAILAGLACEALRGKTFKLHRNSWLKAMLVWIGFMWLSSIVRLSLFGSMIPSGARAKSSGIDGGFLSNGLDYLTKLTGITSWDVLAVGGILALTVVSRLAYLRLPIAIVCLPALSSIAAGGDWFPETWARYLMPTIAAAGFLLTMGFAAPTPFGSRSGDNPNRDTGSTRSLIPRTALSALVPIAVLIGSAPSAMAVYTSLSAPQSNRQGNGRIDCLAQAGELVRLALPPHSGIATAEVNTISYFSKQPLTDLSGLVDPRTASSPFAPLKAGDVMHRRANRNIVSQDKPGAIYLFEGTRCSPPGAASVPLNARVEWNTLINSEITRFRAGAPGELLRDYTPTVFSAPGIELLLLVRTNLLPGLRENPNFIVRDAVA